MRLLTKADVETTVFTPHGFLGRSYDSDEVDEFVDQVAHTLGVNAAIITSQAKKLENYKYMLEAYEAYEARETKRREEAAK